MMTPEVFRVAARAPPRRGFGRGALGGHGPKVGAQRQGPV